MNAQAIKQKGKQKRKIMGDHHFGFLGFLASIMVTIFVTFPHKVMGLILDTAEFINPSAREFILELSPVIGILTGIVVIIMYLYKIKLYRRQIREIDEKSKGK